MYKILFNLESSAVAVIKGNTTKSLEAQTLNSLDI